MTELALYKTGLMYARVSVRISVPISDPRYSLVVLRRGGASHILMLIRQQPGGGGGYSHKVRIGVCREGS